jgi:hypothetical protein
MKLAYLVLAHHQPEHVARLVNRLLHRDAHVFLHVDAKVDIRPFQAAIGSLGNAWTSTHLHFSSSRISVGYMAFSTVEATLSLMRQASQAGPFDYYSLLSGADYPIKSSSAIAETLGSGNREYIVYWKLADRPSWQHKIEYYYVGDLIPIRSTHRPKRLAPHTWARSFPYLYWKAFRRVRDQLPKRRYPFRDLEPYGGSQWWSLSGAAVRYILDFVSERPEVCRFYRYTHCPDELFFQTVLLNSHLADRAVNYADYLAWSETTPPEDKTDSSRLPEGSFNFRYIDWSGPVSGSRRGYPAVLDESDFEALRASPCLFARKFDAVRSHGLLGMIDSVLLDDTGPER